MPTAEAQLDLTIDDEAAAYAREQGGVLTIRTRPQHGCCGGRVDLATVATDPPDDSDAYVQTERDDLTIYVHRSFVSLGDEPIRVGLDRLWIWRSLYVEAASHWMPSTGIGSIRNTPHARLLGCARSPATRPFNST